MSSITLGNQEYARKNPDEDHLRWRRDLSKFKP
ncbi:hypothetical protein Pan97_04340 [Bremerella volcania]|uniref:Uncharacterized protein n=1 Tax=Bremerella volcania TaxID=2527984 RepID=A0A518C2L8_9BACT|nr:hypothetical protein Pan97_04340 [Bremerella volcania]